MFRLTTITCLSVLTLLAASQQALQAQTLTANIALHQATPPPPAPPVWQWKASGELTSSPNNTTVQFIVELWKVGAAVDTRQQTENYYYAGNGGTLTYDTSWVNFTTPPAQGDQFYVYVTAQWTTGNGIARVSKKSSIVTRP